MSPVHQCQSSQGPQPLSSLEGESHGGGLGTLATASTFLLLRPHASVGNNLFSGIISDKSQKTVAARPAATPSCCLLLCPVCHCRDSHHERVLARNKLPCLVGKEFLSRQALCILSNS